MGSRGVRLGASLTHWRGYVARVAAVLSTPLPAVMAMSWDELLLWWCEADDIDRETWGVLRERL